MGIFGKSKERRTSLLDAHDDAHEQELRDAARRGDLATLIDLVEQGVNIEAADPQVLRAASLPTPTLQPHLCSRRSPRRRGRRPSQPGCPPSHHHLTSHLAPHLTSLCATVCIVLPQSGKTALMGAAQEGEVNCLSYLTEKGANVNTQNEDGNTALMYAAQGGKTECLEILMAKGAHLNTKKYSTSGACIVSPCTDVNATGWVSAAPRPCFPAAAHCVWSCRRAFP